MKEGGTGGRKTKTGIVFEGKVDFLNLIEKQKNYSVQEQKILYKNKEVALSFRKHGLYKYLKNRGIQYKSFISKKLLPDDAIFIIANNTFFIIEIKFQKVSGSTDEKLQTCDFKIRQYKKLLSQLKVKVKFVYVLNNWFKKPEYKDVLDYINSIDGCSYHFNSLPLQELGLPSQE